MIDDKTWIRNFLTNFPAMYVKDMKSHRGLLHQWSIWYFTLIKEKEELEWRRVFK